MNEDGIGSVIIAIIVLFLFASCTFMIFAPLIELPSACEDYQKWSNFECYDPAEFRSTIDTLQQTQDTDRVAASRVAEITGNGARLVVFAASEADYYCWREQTTYYCSTKKGGTE